MARKTLKQRRERDLNRSLERQQLETFGLDEVENPNDRVGQLREKIEGLVDPESIMLEILSVFQETEIIPNVGKYYTFIYIPKTKDLAFDNFPLIACIDIFKWGFRGVNFHWNDYRNYTWQEVAGFLHVVKDDEIEYMKTIPYGYFLRTSK